MIINQKYPNYTIYEDGRVYNHKTDRFITTFKDSYGYVKLSLQDYLGKWKKVRLHRVVAETYIPNPENKKEVNHKDGNKSNNHKDNLEWVTSLENKKHAWGLGLYTSVCENHPDATMSNDKVHLICKMLEDGFGNKEICERLNVHKDIVAHIKCGNIWKNISQEYNIRVNRKPRKSRTTVIEICKLIANGLSNKDISDVTKISKEEIQRIRNKSVHKKISDNYF